MTPQYASPGVYVEEIEKGTRPIEALGTSMAAFLGVTHDASLKVIDPKTGLKVAVEPCLNKATLVTSWRQFVDIFGDFTPGAYLPEAVYGYFSNSGGPCYVTSLRTLKEGQSLIKTAEVTIPSKGKASSFKVSARLPGPDFNGLRVSVKLEGEDTFTVSVGDQVVSGLNLKKDESNVSAAKFNQVVISDPGGPTALPVEGTYILAGGGMQPLTKEEIIGDSSLRTGLGGLEAHEDVRLVLCPDLMAGYDGSPEAQERIKSVQAAMIAHCELKKYRFALLDCPPGLNVQQAMQWREYVGFDSSFAALYYPWIRIPDLSGSGSSSKLVPPSGHLAGIFNRSDAERGVHKAPANEVVLGAIDLEYPLSKADQDMLNPIGLNCLRAFPGRGLRIWGARTLSSNGAWRYINVRRLFIMVEASMDVGLQWVVFEPNDSTLWARVSRDVTSFLRNVWRSGALFGDTPEQAYYVKCDSELNPPEVRDLGQLIIEVGLAPVKPAEFVIFRITQWAGANAQA